MANDSLKEIYEKVVEEVKKDPQIEGLRRGLLYKAIQIIFREEKSETQEKTQAICKPLGINSNALENDDYKIIQDLAETVFIDRQPFAERIPGKDMFSNFSMKVSQILTEDKVKWVILAACTLVGVYFCIQYLEAKKKGVNQEQEPETAKLPSLPPPPIPASLCLIVPASAVSNLEKGSDLSVGALTDIIDNASYFLCTTIRNANLNEQRLNMLSDQDILSDSKQDVYIRINIDDSRKLIDNKIRYKLKENLLIQAKAKYVVVQLACLKNLSGLEVFNRV